MKRLLLYLFFFFALGAIGWWLIGPESFVLIRVGETAIQVQLLTAILALVVLMWILNGLVFLLDQLLGGHWLARLKSRKVAKRMRRGIILLLNGEPRKAKEQFLRAANHKQDESLYRMLAVRAAIEAGHYDRALNILNNLENIPSELEGPVRLARSRVMFLLNRLDEADDSCAEAKRLGMAEDQLGLLPLQIAEKRQNWQDYDRRSQKLRRYAELAPALQELDRRVYLGRLSDRKLSLDELQQIRRVLPPEVRHDALIVEATSAALVRLGNSDEAEKILRELLHGNWQPELLNDYVCIPGVDREKQINQLQKWRHRHGDSAELLAALEKISEESGDWQSAQEFNRARQGMQTAPSE